MSWSKQFPFKIKRSGGNNGWNNRCGHKFVPPSGNYESTLPTIMQLAFKNARREKWNRERKDK